MATLDGDPGRRDTGEHHVTRLLAEAAAGDASAFDRLVPLVYGELRRLAQGILAGERAGATLDATGLVHEAWMRLSAQETLGANHRAEFVGAAACAMRRVLVDRARSRLRDKRGGGAASLDLEGAAVADAIDEQVDAMESRVGSIVDLSEALDELRELAPRQVRLVELRFFAGLSSPEAAAVLGQSLRQTERDWTHARAWLRERLGGAPRP